jgi:hypothetical protein
MILVSLYCRQGQDYNFLLFKLKWTTQNNLAFVITHKFSKLFKMTLSETLDRTTG